MCVLPTVSIPHPAKVVRWEGWAWLLRCAALRCAALCCVVLWQSMAAQAPSGNSPHQALTQVDIPPYLSDRLTPGLPP